MNRRQFIAGVASVGSAAIAGCAGGGSYEVIEPTEGMIEVTREGYGSHYHDHYHPYVNAEYTGPSGQLKYVLHVYDRHGALVGTSDYNFVEVETGKLIRLNATIYGDAPIDGNVSIEVIGNEERIEYGKS